MVRIPREIVELEDIHPGEPVEIEVKKARKDWFGAFPQLTPFTKEDRLKSHVEDD